MTSTTRNFQFLRLNTFFSTDHKVIGVQCGITGLLLFLLFGFCLMLMMRWSIAYRRAHTPIMGSVLRKKPLARMPPGKA